MTVGRCGHCDGIRMVTLQTRTIHRGEVVCLECGQHHKWARADELSWAPWASEAQASQVEALREARWIRPPSATSSQGSLL